MGYTPAACAAAGCVQSLMHLQHRSKQEANNGAGKPGDVLLGVHESASQACQQNVVMCCKNMLVGSKALCTSTGAHMVSPEACGLVMLPCGADCFFFGSRALCTSTHLVMTRLIS
jgi:hypothetical protein